MLSLFSRTLSSDTHNDTDNARDIGGGGGVGGGGDGGGGASSATNERGELLGAVLEVTDDEHDMRLDKFVRLHYPTLPRSRVEKLVRTGFIRVDQSATSEQSVEHDVAMMDRATTREKARSSLRLRCGWLVLIPSDVLELAEQDRQVEENYREKRAQESRQVSEARSDLGKRLRDSLLYKDDQLLVLNKPLGVTVQGGRPSSDIEANIEELRFDAKDAPRIVHRLDKDTTGVLVLARTRRAAVRLSEFFRGPSASTLSKEKAARKTYWAVVSGCPTPLQGVVRMPIEKVVHKGQRVHVLRDSMEGYPDARMAITFYETMSHALNEASLLRLFPITGRAHQLRVHLASALHCPIVGDPRYTDSDSLERGERINERLARAGVDTTHIHLHARQLSIPHLDTDDTSPTTRRHTFVAPLPQHMSSTLKTLGLVAPTGSERSGANDGPWSSPEARRQAKFFEKKRAVGRGRGASVRAAKYRGATSSRAHAHPVGYRPRRGRRR